MIETLRPSTLGEILDRTVETYRRRFLLFLGIAVPPAGVVFACAVATFLFFAWIGTEGQRAAADPTMVGILAIVFLLAGTFIFLPVCVAAVALGAGALNHAALAAFQNEKTTILQAYKAAWKRGWRYVGIFALEALMVAVAPVVAWTVLFVIFAVFEGIVGGTPNEAGPALTGIVVLLLLALAVYSVWMLLMVCLSFPASVAENTGPGTAIKRAISLSKGTRGRILVLYILGLVLRWGLGLVLTIPVFVLIAIIPGMHGPQHKRLVEAIVMLAVYGGSFAVRAFTKPVYVIAQLLFYYDQRIRKEGFDIEWMMLQAGMVEPAAPAPKAAPRLPVVPSIASPPGPASAVEPEAVADYAGVPETASTTSEADPAPIKNRADFDPSADTLQPAREGAPQVPPAGVPA